MVEWAHESHTFPPLSLFGCFAAFPLYCPLLLFLLLLLSLTPTESDDEYSDDDDLSWKVRRSSVKCLEAVIGSRRDLLPELYGSVCPALVSRFREREENVKTDIFLAFISLLKQTRGQSTLAPGAKEDPALALLKNQVGCLHRLHISPLS